jgi:hypothetical protein
MSNYETLVNILDQLRKEAPVQHKFYYPDPDNIDALNYARSRAYVHLFIKVKAGLISFIERQQFVTDGANDGGIDGFYIDFDNKKIYLIQSKFRTTQANFEEKEILLQELLKMDAERMLNGETCNEDGKEYSGKVQGLIRKVSEIKDTARWKIIIIILANLTNYKHKDLQKLCGGFECEVFNHNRAYNELVFPIISGTYYNAPELFITLNVPEKGGGSEITYYAETAHGSCKVFVVFIPTIEIAYNMYKYRNAILKYNPRSFLDFSRNPVNREISATIKNELHNEFALFNNGITMLADDSYYTEQNAQKGKAQLILVNPQIINGGQTAYTLCSIYDSEMNNPDPEHSFSKKEVILKVISFNKKTTDPEEIKQRAILIERISRATNQQTAVTEADRKSNDSIQIKIQQLLFQEFSLFYQRKRGEFWNGLHDKYIDFTQMVDRETFLRVAIACNGFTSQARRSSEAVIFFQNKYYDTLKDIQRIPEYVFGYKCLEALNVIEKDFQKEKNNRYGEANYGNALRYGKFAVVFVARNKWTNNVKKEEYTEKATDTVKAILKRWLIFEAHISSLDHNKGYFRLIPNETNNTIEREMNFDNYYKGRTLNKDLENYFADI